MFIKFQEIGCSKSIILVKLDFFSVFWGILIILEYKTDNSVNTNFDVTVIITLDVFKLPCEYPKGISDDEKNRLKE